MIVIQNENTSIRREIATKLLKLFFENKIEQEINKLPITMFPKNNGYMRCCLYKDRTVIRYRIMALLGISIEEDDDETIALNEYYQQAINRSEIKEPILTVLDIACSSCISGKYNVTSMCKGCIARPCKSNCPKDAISIVNGKSVINTALCVNCGKCQTVCPYNAIIYTPVPCEEDCPVGAISKNTLGVEEIDYSKCIYCGKCTRSCPFGAVMERSQIIDVAKHLKNNSRVIAMIAPSIIGQLPGTPEQLFSAIKKLGFEEVIEVAEGAEITAKEEALELTERLKNGENLMGTSCCPAYTEAVKKHAKEFEQFVSHTKSPMHITSDMVNKRYPDHIKVFIGPCIAKKYEGINAPNVDYVLTYEELGSFFVAKEIFVKECTEEKIKKEPNISYGRAFPLSGNVTAAVQHYYGNKALNTFLIDGLSKKGIKQIQLAAAGKIKADIVEVMSCEGGCLYGPGIICNPKISKRALDDFTSRK